MTPANKKRLVSSARPDIAMYLVAVQDKELFTATDGKRWEDIKPGSLSNARNEYDAGFVDLVQQRIGPFEYLQYAIPRKTRATIIHHETFAFARGETAKRQRNAA